MSPTERSLARLRLSAFKAQVVERWNPHARVRVDLFGIIDIVAIRPGTVLGVQACSGGDVSKRVTKALGEPLLRLWLMAGGQFEVWGWAKRGPKGKRKLWTIRCLRLQLCDETGLIKVIPVA